MTAPTTTPTPVDTRSPARTPEAVGRTWWLVHLGTLVLAVPVLAWINRDQWIAGDEWEVITTRGLGSNPTRLGLFAPHFEHWTTLGTVVYKALYGVFAIRTYAPYVAVLILVILAIAHLSWRLLLRIGVVPAYATAVAALTMVQAVGWENRSTAFQMVVIGPVALGFGALLLMPTRGPLVRRDAGVVALLILGLMCSGTGVTMTIVVGAAALFRRGWRIALSLVAAPAVVYGVWFVLEGTTGQRNNTALSTALGDLPGFVWHGLTTAFSDLTRVPDSGVVVLAALVIWLVWRARPRQEPWPLVLATTFGAAVSLSLTGLRRAGATPQSRYSDIVVLLALPALALATQELGRALTRRLGRSVVAACSVLVVAFLVVQVVALDDEVSSEPFVGEMKPRVLAVARIMRDHEPLASNNIYGIPYLGEPSTTTIARLDRNGDLPALDVSRRDILTAREYVETVIGGTPLYPEGVAHGARVRDGTSTRGATGCTVITPSARGTAPSVLLDLPGAGSFRIAADRDTSASLSLIDGADRGEVREFPVGPAGTPVSSSRAATVEITLPAGTTSSVCGLRPEASGTT